MDLWTATPDQLLDAMSEAGLRRAYLITDPETNELRASHELLNPLVTALRRDERDYYGHRAIFFEVGAYSGHLLSAFIHQTKRGQAAGGVRFWSYETMEDFLRDGLRLSRGMGHKNALAGLWWGGGKGVIARRAGMNHLDAAVRRNVYQDYGRFMSGIRGCYVTAEDAGTTTDDMAWIHSTTRHTTCIPERLGGSGNPSILTATGVVVGIEAALHHLGRDGIAGKTVAIQGLGNVTRFMIGDLLRRNVGPIVGVDIDEQCLGEIRRRYPEADLDLRVVPPKDVSIFAEACDVLVPNAHGAVLNPQTIPSIRAAIVCGAANNQLADPARDAAALAARDILYVPDFLTNRMGIVNCANEAYGVFDGDPAILSHLDHDSPTGIFRRSLEVFDRARQSGQSPAAEAQKLADELSEQLHPLWGNRSQQIIDALVRDRWHEQAPIEYSRGQEP